MPHHRPPHPIAQRMARIMRAHEAAAGLCSYRQLLNAGFTPAEIKSHGDTAIALAARMRAAGAPGECLGQPDPARIKRALDRRARTKAPQPQWSAP